ncbi:ABC transporter permease [Kineococcus sp. SYSU DK018]|uniref:ABC transporter permease n=1 Tax=Kineococcus sp. SYSU DK018 TaxID=3383139 RepID=UPI003D7ECD3E
MSTPTPAPARAGGDPGVRRRRPAGALRLTWLHARYQVVETLRVPVVVVSTAVFPALILAVFVVPQSGAAGPLADTAAVAQLAVFSAMSVALFTHGAGISEDRALPWDTHLRTLPVGAGPRFAARVLMGAFFTVVGLVPLLVLAVLLTDATTTPVRFAAGLGGLLVAGLPLLALGLAVGYSVPAKAALALAQVLLLPLAFAGGLFLPPQAMPGWLASISTWTPTRAGRDVVIGAATGLDVPATALPVLLGWTVVLGAVAVWAIRRDEGRRFR